MLFNSFEFLLFLPIVLIGYFLLQVKLRWIWLLIASYIFYSYWNPWYIFLILGSTLTDYLAAIQIAKSRSKQIRKKWLAFSLFVNLGLLFTFKYFDFFSLQLSHVIHWIEPQYQAFFLDILLPLGISFYTFQTLGYTLDVYRGKYAPERHLGRFALYVNFFPQLVAGPIERAQDLLPQFHFNYSWDYQRVVEGLRLLLWGFFKKMVIADRLGLFVSAVFDQPGEHSGPVIWIAAALFFLQVYYDFSAYQDIAVGIARIMGVKLSQNFVNRAYVFRSFSEFWRGWHITLTRWVRDYLYIPLGGSQKGENRTLINILIIMFAIGLWHGAAWTFIVWGGLNGLFLAIERMLRNPINRLENRISNSFVLKAKNILAIILCFNLYTLTMFAFRAPHISDSIPLLVNVFDFSHIYINPGISNFDFYLGITLVILMDFFLFKMKDTSIYEYLENKPMGLRWILYFILISSILYLSVPEQMQFIYFEF